jgi:hypothetical protein
MPGGISLLIQRGWEDQWQARLQMVNQKSCIIRFENAQGASGEKSSSVLIREIRGEKSC